MELLKVQLESENLPYEISDLYEMDFETDMSEMEYERKGFVNLSIPIPLDVQKEHEEIAYSDCITFLYSE